MDKVTDDADDRNEYRHGRFEIWLDDFNRQQIRIKTTNPHKILVLINLITFHSI